MPAFDDAEREDPADVNLDMEDDGLMAFSQALNSAGEFRTGEANDDDEMDGAIFFADADEAREL